jgi:hypothetical protein
MHLPAVLGKIIRPKVIRCNIKYNTYAYFEYTLFQSSDTLHKEFVPSWTFIFITYSHWFTYKMKFQFKIRIIEIRQFQILIHSATLVDTAKDERANF